MDILLSCIDILVMALMARGLAGSHTTLPCRVLLPYDKSYMPQLGQAGAMPSRRAMKHQGGRNKDNEKSQAYDLELQTASCQVASR